MTRLASILAVAALLAGKGHAYCNWNDCNGVVQGGEWCNVNQNRCEIDCDGKWCTRTANTPAPVPPTTPTVATTTRYWDCSGGACGCAYLPFGPGSDSLPAHCHSNAMFAAPKGNPYGASFYGSAAVSQALGGGDWLAEGCGKCWRVTGTSNIPSFDGVSTTLVLKATNYCPPSNPACSDGKAHFDIAAPGFDYLSSSLSNSCLTREASEITGFRSCQNWMISSTDPNQNCDCTLFQSDVLRNGCENFRTLYWDNVQVIYEEVICPQELNQLPCWEENGNGYPTGIPEFCFSNVGSGSTPTSSPPTPSPTPEPTPSQTSQPVAPTPQPV